MNVNLNLHSRGSICEGCLSVDRNLTLVLDESKRRLYSELLNNNIALLNHLFLCWECAGLLSRVLKFKLQVLKAHDSLLKQIPTPPLSTLSTWTNTTIYQYEHTHSVAPLAFVKVEDEVFDDDFGDDPQVSEHDERTETSIESYKPVPETQSQETKPKSSEDFNNSDDEPLGLKKKPKQRGRRKKKEKAPTEEDPPAPPNPPGVRKRREQPPGVVNNPRVLKKLEQLRVPPTSLEMIVLSWSQVEEERQKALASDAFTRHEWRCADCALGFNHRCKLDEHMKKHRPCVGAAECAFCHTYCKDAHALAAHRRRHRLRWRCVWCGGAWSRAAVAADHVAREHGAPSPTHSCSVCGHTEPSLGKLRNHLKDHAERQKCEICGKTFRDKTSLRTHLFIHRGEKEYACTQCDKRFLFKRAMEIHIITHAAPALLYCRVCDMNFKNRMSYNQHMKYSLKHVDPAKLKYACQLCDKKFLKAVRLEEHNLAVHLKITPIQCTVAGCNFACSSRPVLRTHIRMLHRRARDQRNHVCDVCGKAYTTKSSLAGHLRTHTGERPFRCARCPAAFAHEATLYNHDKLVHRREKPIRSRPANLPPTEDATPAPSNLWPLNVPTITLNTHIEQ